MNFFSNILNKKKKAKTFYITTTLPYVNGKPHIGFAMEIVRADVLARYKREILGKENVFFNTGTDEHGKKILENAEKENLTPKEYADKMSKNFSEILPKLNISHNNFVRTTDEDHKKSAQKFWQICFENGFIYKKNYKSKYCFGCELEKTDSELEDGICPLHLNNQIEIIEEENYFFKFSQFEKSLLKYFKKNPIIPDFRKKEIENFVKKDLKDFSISRKKEKMPWGVEVPNDSDHVIYVWFDALVNYISALGWGKEDDNNFKKFWQEGEVFQIAGKDNLRQQSAIWQAMLFSTNIKNTDKIFINGFINGEGGIKMSKSLGNVILPEEILEKYNTDALRYFFIRHINNHEDSDFSKKIFHEAYMANLVNGIGNLTNRILKMSQDFNFRLEKKPKIDFENLPLKDYDFNKYADFVWQKISDLDKFITNEKPYKKIKQNDISVRDDLIYLLEKLFLIAQYLKFLMPESSEKILEAIEKNQKPEKPLFEKIDFS